MRFEFTDEQRAFQQTVRDFLDKRCTPTDVRAAWDGDSGISRSRWQALAELGPSTFPAPGMVGERHFYFHVEVDPACISVPTEDGSALERGAVVAAIPVDAAIDLCRRGEIEDAKTEVALRRLAEL